MSRWCYTVANLLGGVVLALLLIDPARDLTPIFLFHPLAGLLVWVARYLAPEE